MDAQQPPYPGRPVVTEIRLTRLGTAIFSVLALMFSIGALIVADNAGGTGVDGAATGSALLAESDIPSSATKVSLTEFAFSPKHVMVNKGSALKIVNNGAVEHTLAVDGTDLVTPTLGSRGVAGFSLGSLAPGSYQLSCTIPGHKAAGMTGELMVLAEGAEVPAGMTSGGMTADEMDEHMAIRTKAFPAKTAGVGGEVLAPDIQIDGTKVWHLTATIVDWEVEPGKIVEAWTYNGAVPGPTLKAEPGDKVRIMLKNELPESTSIHFHGLETPNAMDGVPDITQAPVKPGTSFSYEFVAKGPAVGMYHSHQNAVVQVPNGLAGAFIVGRAPLPAGVTVSQEIPMMLNDAGTIGLTLNGKSFPATAPVATGLGDAVLVHYMNEGMMAHPMHLHGLVQRVIAKDGIPLEFPYDADTINVAPGERYSVLIRASTPGVWAWHCHILTHAESSDGMFGMVTAMIVK